MMLKCSNHQYVRANQVVIADYDVICQIQANVQKLKTITLDLCEFCHVKGHQDQDIEYEKLSWQAQLNMIANELTSQQLTVIKDMHR